MGKKIKTTSPVLEVQPSIPLEPTPVEPAPQVSESPIELVQSDSLVQTPPLKPVKAPRIRTKKVQKTEIIEQNQLEPVNLLEKFNEVSEKVVQDVQNQEQDSLQPNEECYQAMQIDQSFDSEVYQITNPEQRKLAQEAKDTLKRDIIQQAHDLVHDHLTDFPPEYRSKASELVVRLYDDPVSLFTALKTSNRGALKLKFKNLPRPTLLGEQKNGVRKLEGFRQFLSQRINRR